MGAFGVLAPDSMLGSEALPPNQSPEATAVGFVSSAVAVHVASQRRGSAIFGR